MILLHKTHLAPIMLAFCFLLLPSYYAPNFAGKIDASLDKAFYHSRLTVLFLHTYHP